MQILLAITLKQAPSKDKPYKITDGVKVRNPSFDVTPVELVSGLITGKSVVFQPDQVKMRALLKEGL